MSAWRPFRRRGRHRPPDGYSGMQLGWAAGEEDLPAARKATHDALIAQMADRRTGGVTWREFAGASALEALERLWAVHPDPSPANVAHYEALRFRLRLRGGFLVIATAPGRP